MKQVLKEESSIDYLVNAAGITRNRLLIQMKNDDLEDVINTNLLGTMRVSQLVSKAMLRKRKGGCIINISSVVGLQGNAGQTIYAASKAGVVGKIWICRYYIKTTMIDSIVLLRLHKGIGKRTRSFKNPS